MGALAIQRTTVATGVCHCPSDKGTPAARPVRKAAGLEVFDETAGPPKQGAAGAVAGSPVSKVRPLP